LFREEEEDERKRDYTEQTSAMNGFLQLIELRALPILVTSVAIMSLCGCTSEETAGRFLVAPGQYVLYSCGEMADQARAIANRQHELAALMQKAETDAGGRFVSAQAYQPEYNLLRGRMDQLRKTAAEKNCNLSGGVSGASGLPVEQPTSATERNWPVRDGGFLTGQ
jgi:hypothetical protein